MPLELTRDRIDKANEAAEDALGVLAGVKSDKALGMRCGSVLEIGRRYLAAALGEGAVLKLDRRQVAGLLLGKGYERDALRLTGLRDAANVTSGMFTSYVLANVLDKALYQGFNASQDVITYPLWCAEIEREDFKSFTGGALDVGNLVETAENIAFPELAKGEGGYVDQLGLWGATATLTFQALMNDDLGEFMRAIGRAGFIARRTVDVKVYATLEAATWTNRTTAGNLSDDQVNALRASMSGITGPAGEVLGLTPRFLIVPAGLRGPALTISQIAQYIAPEAVKVNLDLIPIVTPFLTTKATAANSVWYLAVDQIFEACIVNTLRGMAGPVVEEYDAGAVAARKFKIMYPFKVTLPTVSSNVQGMWRGEGT